MDTTHTAVKGSELHEQLAAYTRAWARHKVFFGTSCTYRRLGEHAQIFSTACVDVSPQVPVPPPAVRVFLPQEFRLGVALMSEGLVYRFPHRHPVRVQQGATNERFLDAGLLQEHLQTSLSPVVPHGSMVVLPIEQIYRTENLSSTVLFEKLNRLLGALSPHYRYAVELRNREYLLPDYLDILREREVAHVLTACIGMPSVLEQIQLPHILTTDVAVVRATPYMDTDLQLGIMETIRCCIDGGTSLYIYIEDRGEDSSTLHAIEGLMDLLNADLARLSPIRTLAARAA